MAKQTFTSEELAAELVKVKAAGGTRVDLTVGLMNSKGVEVTKESRAKWYNNVAQRLKALETAGVAVPALEAGKRGGKRSAASLDAIKAILAAAE